ncbi:hypothetical protein STENM327S_03017 [Streptomyces tendae]
MDRETYYQPTGNGYEAQIIERLRHWAALAGAQATRLTPQMCARRYLLHRLSKNVPAIDVLPVVAIGAG